MNTDLTIIEEIPQSGGDCHLMPSLDKMQPPSVKMALAFETARFIQASNDEVVRTHLEVLVIVVAVIYLCLGALPY